MVIFLWGLLAFSVFCQIMMVISNSTQRRLHNLHVKTLEDEITRQQQTIKDYMQICFLQAQKAAKKGEDDA